MKWANPSYEVIKMDAEIGSYQLDPDVPVREFTGAARPADEPRGGFGEETSAERAQA